MCWPDNTACIYDYYRQYTIKVFLCGDYEFLCRMHGISGASGVHVYDDMHIIMYLEHMYQGDILAYGAL